MALQAARLRAWSRRSAGRPPRRARSSSRLTSASSGSASVSAPSRVTPLTDRKSRSAKCPRTVRTANGPTNERVRRRSDPADPDELDVRRLALVADQLHDGQAVGDDRELQALARGCAGRRSTRSTRSRGRRVSLGASIADRRPRERALGLGRDLERGPRRSPRGRERRAARRRRACGAPGPGARGSARSRRAVIDETPKRSSSSRDGDGARAAQQVRDRGAARLCKHRAFRCGFVFD